MRRKINIGVSEVISPTAALLMFSVGWEILTRATDVSPLILPGPTVVIGTLVLNFGHLLTHAAITLAEAGLGFLLGAVVAVALAVAFQFSATAKRSLYPYAIAVKAIPLVALAPIIVVWFGTGASSKVVLAAIISFFPVLVNTVQGLRSVESEALDLMVTFSASKAEVLRKVRFPTALPYIFSGMKISATFAVVGAVVAEFVGSQRGIGYLIKSSSYYLDTSLTFAAIIVAAAAGLAFFGAVAFAEWLLIFWAPATMTDKETQ